MGFSKRTLHYLKKNAEGNRQFTIDWHKREKLERRSNIVQIWGKKDSEQVKWR